MKRPLVIAAIAATTFVGLLAGCSSSPAATSAPPSAPGPDALAKANGVVDIAFWHALGGANGQALQKLVDQFNADNTSKIHVEATYQGSYNDTLAKYTASVKNGSSPTVLLSGDISAGFLYDVKNSISPEDMAAANPGDLNVGDLVPVGKNYYTIEGHLAAVPMNMSVPLLWINKDLLAKAGIKDYSSLSTLDGVVAAAKQVTAAAGVPGLDQPLDAWWFEQLSAASGSELCTPGNGRSAGGATAVSLDAPAQRAAFQKMVDLYGTAAALNTGVDGGQAVTAFDAGKVAMMFNSSGAAGGIQKGAQFAYTALPYPISGDKAKSGVVVGGGALWLGRAGSDAQKVAGWKLISYLVSPESQLQFSQASGYIPVNKKVPGMSDEKSYLASNPHAQVALDVAANLPIVPATAGCLSGAMTAIRNALIPQWQAAFAKKSTLDEAIKTGKAQADQAIQQYRDQAGK